MFFLEMSLLKLHTSLENENKKLLWMVFSGSGGDFLPVRDLLILEGGWSPGQIGKNSLDYMVSLDQRKAIFNMHGSAAEQIRCPKAAIKVLPAPIISLAGHSSL